MVISASPQVCGYYVALEKKEMGRSQMKCNQYIETEAKVEEGLERKWLSECKNGTKTTLVFSIVGFIAETVQSFLKKNLKCSLYSMRLENGALEWF